MLYTTYIDYYGALCSWSPGQLLSVPMRQEGTDNGNIVLS